MPNAFIRKLNDKDGNVILPASRAAGIYFDDDSVLQDYVVSEGVMKKALGDKNGKDLTSYVTGLSVNGRTITFTKGDGTSGTIQTQDTNTTYSAFKGATSSAAGGTGLVPAPAQGDQAKFLKADGTWQTPPNTTYSNATTSTDGLMSSEDKTKLDGIEKGANKYTHPSYTNRTSGLYKITVDATGHVSAATAVTKTDITALGIPGSDTNTTYTTFKGATASAAGGTGLVPAPASGQNTRYLRGDGTWQTPPNTTYGVATDEDNGLMSAADKAKLDGIASGANNYTHPTFTAKNAGLYKITVNNQGHVTAATAVVKGDITALGIPAQDTTYTNATSYTDGLMSSEDKTKLDGIASGANKTTVDTALSTSSTNPVRNSVVTSALNGKASTSHTHSTATTYSAGFMSASDKTFLNSLSNSVVVDTSWGSAVSDIP